uniref:RHS repeat-associated core domain-containing protein n=1 Tax=Comamonas composti TaxID=408558 RepID=UPI00146FB8C2
EYKAWGEAKVQALWAAGRAGASSAQQVRNPLRFQGQYFDEETGLHYNRFRYYDPHCGRFVSRDPIGLAGGINTFQYAPNAVGWVDPLGLNRLGGGKNVGAQRRTCPKCCSDKLHGPFHRVESPTQSRERAAEQEALGIHSGTASHKGMGVVRINAYDGPLPEGQRGLEFYTPAKPTSVVPGGLVTWHPGHDPHCTLSEDREVAQIPIKVTKNTQK